LTCCRRMPKGRYPMHKIEILPSLLAADFADLRGQIRKIEAAGCSKLHLDIMDGNFVPNITFGPALIKSIEMTSLLGTETFLLLLSTAKVESPKPKNKTKTRANKILKIFYGLDSSSFLSSE